MKAREQYLDATIQTGNSLKTIAHSQSIQELSSMSLPEVDAIVDLIAKVAPAGNVPGVILNGLIRLPARRPPIKDMRRDVNLLFKGVEQALRDKAVFGAFFAGPAAVIWAYQNLLRLAGKDADGAFPEGTWQFYVDYALRDDTARHACETHGFDTTLKQHHIHLMPVDRLTAWIMAAIYCLHQYDRLLANEWRERVYTMLLQKVTENHPDATRYARLYRVWEKQRPYQRSDNVDPRDDYPTYRQKQFDQFLAAAMRDLPPELQQEWQNLVQEAVETELPAYQQQMSILAYLDPSTYGETRTPIPLKLAHVGVIYEGHYYLIPACAPDSDRPAHISTVRAQVATMLHRPSSAPPANLKALACIKRENLCHLRDRMDETLSEEFDQLRMAPIWLNADQQSAHLPLAVVRQAERGIGDHPMTIFDTGETYVFDLSHIFFDGAWSVALAEIMTNEALAWATYLERLAPAQPGPTRPYSPLLQLSAADQERLRGAAQVAREISVETDRIDLEAILNLRKLFKQRSDLLQLTVNDLLLLYRAIHAALYQPHPEIVTQLRQLMRQNETQTAAALALTAVEKATNPAILMPVDASRRLPRDRVYPITFEVPLDDLNLLSLHQKTIVALEACLKNKKMWADFDQLQRDYLGTLAAFGKLLTKAKEIAVAGESSNVATIKLMAHLPTAMQRLLDKIPGHFDILNDIIKGREVFSNVGVVAPGSTLTRFITAKDNNEKKTLTWGVLTDAEGVMRLTLRDFRPHVADLTAVNQRDLAVAIAKDYLDAYADGLNQYVNDLHRITKASRKR